MILTPNKLLNTHVVRVICDDARKSGNQYTITLLPSWLHPYFRRLVCDTLQAIGKFITRQVRGYHVAALEMHAESDRTFRRYYYRAKANMPRWVLLLTQLMAVANQRAQENRCAVESRRSQSDIWHTFCEAADEYCKHKYQMMLSRLPLYGEWVFRYVLYLMNANELGLGP